MADTQPSPKPTNSNAMTIETNTEAPQASSVTTTGKGEQTSSKPQRDLTTTIGGDPSNVPDRHASAQREDTGRQSPDATPGAGDDGDGAGGDQEGNRESDTGVLEDLGDYDPENSEVAAKFDERYFSDDGTLHLDNLSNEWAKNVKDGQPGKLNEGTYKYLKDRLGLTKEAIDRIGRGLEADNREKTSKFYEGAGGKDRFDAALAWGKAGGYTKDQQARFNEQINKGGQDAEDARDALMARFNRTRNKEDREAKRRGPSGSPRREANARRDAAQGASGSASAAKPFASRDEYTKAYRATDPKDTAAMANLRQRLLASPDHVRF